MLINLSLFLSLSLSLSLRHVEEAIKHVLQERPPLPHLRAGLTSQDIFYSQVKNGIKDLVNRDPDRLYIR